MIIRNIAAIVELEAADPVPTGTPRQIARQILQAIKSDPSVLEIRELVSKERGGVTYLHVVAGATPAESQQPLEALVKTPQTHPGVIE